jgi:3-hydroxyisobutyrate dehydrogenase
MALHEDASLPIVRLGGRFGCEARAGSPGPVTRVAFLGTGTMGLPMARHVLEAGLTVHAWNRSPERVQPLAEHGARLFDDPRDAAQGCTLIVTMLTDAGVVLDTAARALGGAERDVTWLQMSTIGIEGIERCEALAERFAVRLVDAPVLGTREPAEQGQLVILAAGQPDALDAGTPVFDAVGSRTLRFERVGEGTRCKLVVNSWVVGVTGLLAETISLAEVLGIDPECFFEAIEDGPLDLPYARLKGHAMIEKSFDDAAFRLALSRKDADLVLAAAENHQLDVPVLRAVAARLNRAEQEGHGDADMAATYLATARR